MSNQQLLTSTHELPQNYQTERARIIMSDISPPVAVYKLWQLDRKYNTKQRGCKATLVTKKNKLAKLFATRKIVCDGPFVNVFLCAGNIKQCLQVEPRETLEQVAFRYNIDLQGAWFTVNSKPLRTTIALCEYGVCEGSTIFSHGRLFGGSNVGLKLRENRGSSTHRELLTHHGHTHHLRLYTHVRECERELLDEENAQGEMRAMADMRRMLELQGSSEDSSLSVQAIMTTLSTVKDTLFLKHEWLFEVLESFFHTVYWFKKCECVQDYTVIVALAHKLMTGKSMSSRFMQVFGFKSELQGEFTNFVKQLRDLYTTTNGMIGKDSLLMKVRKVYTYLLVQGILKPVGLSLSEEQFLAMEAKIKVDNSHHMNMAFTMFDVAITICERIDAFILTGDVCALVHDDIVYAKWLKEADRILGLAPFTSNLKAHGTSYFAFVADLNDALERGEAMCGYSRAHSGVEGYHMRRKLDSLRMLKNTEITRRASQKERRAPFGALIYGGSSVAKSTFTKMMFYYYGKLHGLKTDDHFRYVRNPTDEYWSNFDSSKWCIQLDDIAFLLPSKSSDVDATLKEMLNVINNVPYVPPQAALEDKGKTPVVADLVLATTNAAHINAQEYFYCPLAVRRRLPFVVNIRPKEEYLSENKQFIDPSKLPPIEGAYPDYWIITLQKLVPVRYQGRDSAKLVDVETFTDVRRFLRVYGEATKAHKATQDKSQTCDAGMRDIDVCASCCGCAGECWCPAERRTCAKCQLTECKCIRMCSECKVDPCCCDEFCTICDSEECTCPKICQLCFKLECTCQQGALSAIAGIMLFDVVWNIFQNVLAWFMTSWLCLYLARFYGVRMGIMLLTRFLDAGVEFKISGILNSNRNVKLKVTVRKLLVVGKLLASMFITYKASSAIWRHCTKPITKKKSISEPSCKATEWDVESVEEFDEQGNVMGTTEEQLAKETSQNVWYNSTLEMCRFDVPLASQSLCKATPEDIRSAFSANCVRLVLKGCNSGITVRTCGTFVKGQWLLLNKHIVDWTKDTRVEMQIVTGPTSQGLTPNVTFYFDVSEFKINAERDIALINVRGYPPVKDILKFWGTQAITATNIVSVRREFDGTVSKIEMFGGAYNDDFPVTTLDRKMPIYFGQSAIDTKTGDCGSLAVAKTPMGPVIVGQHMLGHNTTAGFVCILRSDIEKLIGDDKIVVAGTPPRMSLNGDIQLSPPHHRSLLRYMDQGTVRVYGSLPGFRAKPKSRVCTTPLQPLMCTHFGVDIEFGPPVMDGWAPWKKNVVEMVKPHMDIDMSILTHCTEAFRTDIIAGLTAKHGDQWKGQLVFLSDRAAVNGLPGVKYVDRINTNTSMGFPWSTPKKRFLEADVSPEYPEGVTFTPEVWERVRKIEESYARGERAYPIFTGHLKDEPTALKKIEEQKTRVFTGAPVDWSLVVRSRLLTFVRLLQKNKFIFEAGPGTVCQSVEWTEIHKYLTEFGEEQIVAGDYGKFDKRMIAQFVLAAFDIIVAVYREAGFSDDECRQIRCIGVDTAFPVVNMNGDIIEFYGTNPSGHPLTVIVNSLVNSLYMRYAYCLANPEGKNCANFKRDVHLFTYGDDNIMGVSKACPWFNHCVIQKHMQTIGVEYTMADKESESVPYISLKETSFLKRSWRWEEELQAYVCPLEEKSIHKSLTMWVPSRTIDKHMQMVAVISSANSEYFFYGREVFEKHHAFFKNVLELEPFSYYVEENTLPGWDALCKRFREASKGLE